MAPEQFENADDHRSDIYSLGLTVHHALTGRIPMPGSDPDAVMLMHKRGELDPVHFHCPQIRREVSELVRRMTAVDPARRFDTYDDLIRSAEAAFGLRLEMY
jgi:serine/threonine-protein kinase